jgi:hypothetical protein
MSIHCCRYGDDKDGVVTHAQIYLGTGTDPVVPDTNGDGREAVSIIGEGVHRCLEPQCAVLSSQHTVCSDIVHLMQWPFTV